MSKANANTEYAGGAAKENVGHVTGSDNLKARGRAQRERGNAEYETANANDNYDHDNYDHDTTGNKGSKTGGHLHATKGAMKQNLGSALGKDKLERSGAHERGAGNQQIEEAKAQSKVGGKKDQAKGTVKEKTGHAVGNPQWEAEGRGEHIKGQARNANSTNKY